MGDFHAGFRPSQRPLYRVIWINSAKLIDGAEIIRSIDDREAIATARGMADGRSVELWDRNRFIARFNAVCSPSGDWSFDLGRAC